MPAQSLGLLVCTGRSRASATAAIIASYARAAAASNGNGSKSASAYETPGTACRWVAGRVRRGRAGRVGDPARPHAGDRPGWGGRRRRHCPHDLGTACTSAGARRVRAHRVYVRHRAHADAVGVHDRHREAGSRLGDSGSCIPSPGTAATTRGSPVPGSAASSLSMLRVCSAQRSTRRRGSTSQSPHRAPATDDVVA